MAYFNSKELWCGGEIYEKHRIPGMIVTATGTVIVYNEARRTEDDWSLMDILMQRSTDGGDTFSAPTALAKGNEVHPTVNNPVMMQDKSGRIHFLWCEDYSTNGGRVLHRYSDDDGITWSDPIDITRFTSPELRTCFALGPGHGICLRDGSLLVPVWLVPSIYDQPTNKHDPSVVTTLVSRDCGESWELGEWLWTNAQIVSPNETTAAELDDGRVYLNIRHKASYRAHAYSADGLSDWKDYEPDRALLDARCCGSLTRAFDGNGKHILLFGNCFSQERDHVSVHLSRDGGKSWCARKLIDEHRGGYVEMAADNASGRIYLIYEEDWGAKCHLVRFDLDWLTQ